MNVWSPIVMRAPRRETNSIGTTVPVKLTPWPRFSLPRKFPFLEIENPIAETQGPRMRCCRSVWRNSCGRTPSGASRRALERGIKPRINRAVPMGLIRGKSEGLVLPRPFDGQITQARDPQPVRQMPIDCGFDEIGRKESQRYCHVDFAHAACGAGGDALGRGRRILNQLLEPTAPLRNRSNQCRFRLKANGPRTLLR